MTAPGRKYLELDRVGARSLAFLARVVVCAGLVWESLLVGCNVYVSPSPSSPASSTEDRGNLEGGSSESSTRLGDAADSGARDSSSGPMPDSGCKTNPTPVADCPLICPEICNGKDDDCDGKIDEPYAPGLCVLSHARSACDRGKCRLVECVKGYGDCDGRTDNGCETSLDTLDNCGGCSTRCLLASCAGSVCSDLTCAAFMANCDGDSANSCEVNLHSISDCGGCSKVGANQTCAGLANVAIASCETGGCLVTSCTTGYADCDHDAVNGCEREIATAGRCETNAN